jgi:quercetin dioxygenase-like cupin family protein
MINEKIKNCLCSDSCNIKKGWGEEIVFVNNNLYCGKLLIFKQGLKFSMHYHLIKDETWYVNEGEFIYRWIDTTNGTLLETNLTKGDVVRQLPGQPHQLEALTDGVIFEVSTEHYDSDSYRIWKGN